MNINQVIADANQAGNILGNPHWSTLRNKIQDSLFDDWCCSSTVEEREEIWRTSEALNLIINALDQEVLDGQMAENRGT